jgi:hypothetical protein
VADAARLGATCAWLGPAARPGACFAEACALLADYAAGRMVRLCVEKALPWIEEVGHPNLSLWLDLADLPPDEAARLMRQAGPRLGGVCVRGTVGQVETLPHDYRGVVVVRWVEETT